MTNRCRLQNSYRSTRVSGFSLIELMISLTIGLIIMTAAFSAFIGASSASKMANAQSRMNEDAQAALGIITQQLRMAGNNPYQPSRVDDVVQALSSLQNPVYLPLPTYSGFLPLKQVINGVTTPYALFGFAIRGCDGNFSNINDATITRVDDLICLPDLTKPDSFAISYEADQFNTVGGIPTDCIGKVLPVVTATLPTFTMVGTPPAPVVGSSIVNYSVASNRFYIATAATSLIPSLYCKGNGFASVAQPLVENVEDMQISYGTLPASTLDSAIKTTSVAGYLRADQVSSNSNLAALPTDAARWAKVITVRVCIQVRSETPVVSSAASASYLKCDGTVSTPQTDLRLRRVYSTTVVLRNRRA